MLYACVLLGCSAEPDRCGPSTGTVSRVIDGDTVELASGERVRYLMVNAPEITAGKHECFGADAQSFNRALVANRRVELRYDTTCTDRYGRVLAYVSADGQEVNTTLVAEGYARVLRIPPNGAGRALEFESLEASARARRLGLWGLCSGPR